MSKGSVTRALTDGNKRRIHIGWLFAECEPLEEAFSDDLPKRSDAVALNFGINGIVPNNCRTLYGISEFYRKEILVKHEH